ncbi:hypothetical protein [Candidatus Frankia alpina]|uniref:hypothetical protein n=1 Tax=Candidatus Frankia alpina TaxID=2699483 RepID=UPI0013D08445|nr:hypothetical protein [Candidatus Frankia alpina]
MSTQPTARHDAHSVGAGSDAVTAERLAALADGLYAAWAEPAVSRRDELLADCCIPAVTYANPLGEAVGIIEFADLIGEFLAPYPGHRPVRTSGVDVHHRRARWEWGLRNSIGQIVLMGLDVVTFTERPRLETISTFFGPPPRPVYSFGAAPA